MHKITITNTISGKKEICTFSPDKSIKLYVCGITPYDYAHIGHGRCYVTFDVLYRLLTFLGYSVTYCRNFTDIDDKLLNKAEKELGERFAYTQVAQKFINAFHDDVQQLNCLTPTYEPYVTQNIDAIIECVEGLIANGSAYVVDGDVYFSIDAFPAYGKLSKRKIDDLMAGARVQISEKKRNPLDFALWKSEAEGTFWQSPWGYGRPGWHIECSALAKKFLGTPVDIHGGGMDLIFPHHENEVAQSEALHGAPFVRYWMHNAFVRIHQEKMSKSLGNFFTLRDVFKQYDPMVVRYYFLQHQYRNPLDFAFDDLNVAQKNYQRLCKIFNTPAHEESSIHAQERSDIGNKMLDFLTDDLNTPGMFGVIFEHLHEIEHDAHLHAAIKYLLQEILGLTLTPLAEKEIIITPEIQALITEREEARAAKNWKRSDELRAQLQALGFNVQDKKS